MRKLMPVLIALLSFQFQAQADQRYNAYCVTTPSFPTQVLVYDDLAASYIEEYFKTDQGFVPQTYLHRAVVYELPFKILNASSLTENIIKKVSTREDRFDNDSKFPFSAKVDQTASMLYSGPKTVDATQSEITISQHDSKTKSLTPLYRLPFLTDLDNSSIPQGDVKAEGLLFRGVSVPSVRYSKCGDLAD